MKLDLEKIAKSYQGEEAENFSKQMFKRVFGLNFEDTNYQAYADKENNQVVMELVFKRAVNLNYEGMHKEYQTGDILRSAISYKHEPMEIAEIFQETGLKIKKQIESSQKDYQLIIAEAV